MKKIIVLTIFCTLLFSIKGYSQQASYTSAQYSMGFATGEMGEYISQASFRGALLEYRAALSDNLMVGTEVGWYTFYQAMDYDTYTNGNTSLTGKQYRYQNEVPLLFSADYLVSSDKALKPYIGFGIGTIYTERSTDMNLYRKEINAWQFAIKPEIGFLYEISFDTSVKLALKYYNGFETGKIENQGFFSLSVGFAFHID